MSLQVISSSDDLQLSAYDYVLPLEQIAQDPVVPRDRSRLLIVTTPQDHCHQQFYALPDFLKPGDLLVLNDTSVIPARLHGQKIKGDACQPEPGQSLEGAQVEVLLLEEQDEDCWLALVKPGKRLKPGSQIIFAQNLLKRRECSSTINGCLDAFDLDLPGKQSKIPGSQVLKATIIANESSTGGRILQFHVPENTTLWDWIKVLGQVPLPPYIMQSHAKAAQYQTVYGKRPGAVAAPTAGLHFTPDLLERLEERGIRHTFITLHVGIGTFRPVETENIAHHRMHGEWVEVSFATVERIQQTKQQGGRIIAVGTTVVRSLEGAAQSGILQPYCGKVNLFIYPGYSWQVIDGLITNFHLPRSSLLMLVSALIGRRRLLQLYEEAVALKYRFYSFGDAMCILPEAWI